MAIKTQELREDIRQQLNRPEEDDLFDFPGEYDKAATKAQRYFYKLVAQHYPELLKVVATVNTADSGSTYVLTDDHFGEIELWTPPGPPTGDMLLPALPEQRRFGWYQQGKTIHLTTAKVYSPLYVRWIPATVSQIDEATDPVLPEYFRDALVFRAAYELSTKPGFLGDSDRLKLLAVREWSGDPDESSDMGILGILSRQAAYGGVEGVTDGNLPWYKGISTGV